MTNGLIALGSNLHDRQQLLNAAITAIENHPAIELSEQSSFYETDSIGGPEGQGAFLNAAITIQTTLAPEALLQALQQIENQLGRERNVRWDARTIDLDILLFDQLQIDTEQLQVPHPRMIYRRFVLQPAVEIAADWIHPNTDLTVAELLDNLDSTAWYLAITGQAASGKTALAAKLSQRVNAILISDPLATLGQESQIDNLTPWQLENNILNQRADLLSAEKAWPTDRPIISDFALQQSMFYAQTQLKSEQFELFQNHLLAAQQQVIHPRLTVQLSDVSCEPSCEKQPQHEPAGRITTAQQQENDQIFLNFRASQDKSLVLTLAVRDQSALIDQSLIDELTAAILAMK